MPFDGTVSTQATRDLINARDILVRFGWQKEAGTHGHQHCPVTAVMEAQGYTISQGLPGLCMIACVALTPRFRRAYKLLKDGLPPADKRRPFAVLSWNVVQNSSAPALRLFDRAISKSL